MPAFAWASKIWKRIEKQKEAELKNLKEKWKLLLFGLACQYIHGLAARVAHFLHQPGRILPDIGYRVLPELGPQNAYMSETLFSFLFFSFILWTFRPFVVKKPFCTVSIWCQVLITLSVSQFLRIVSFLSTQLPGPNYHCRKGSPVATLPPPKSIAEVVLLNLPYGALYGCGDLIFSSHMIFILVFVWTYQKYGTRRWIKGLAWLLSTILSLLIIASRKHYTVDVVVAWYTVALVFYLIEREFFNSDIMERTDAPLLPSVLRNKSKEDMGLINGNYESMLLDGEESFCMI